MLLNQFIVLTDVGLEVHCLSPEELASYYDRLRIATKRHEPNTERFRVQSIEAARYTFGRKTESVIRCFPLAVAVAIAENYTGPFTDQVRGLAALIALGEPLNQDGTDQDGGTRAALVDRPKVRPPGSGNDMELTTQRGNVT